jgi:hypothetical protein
VYIDGRARLSLAAASPRADVGRLYRRGSNHGFSASTAVPAGAYRVCAYAIDSAGRGNPVIGCRNVTVINHAPIGVLDSATTSPGVITVRGWALDHNTTSPIRVHVYVDGRATVALDAAGSRPDVGRVFGKGANHGFIAAFKATYGSHQVCVYAINTPAGPNPRLACRNVVVTNLAPVGALESVTSGMDSFTASGWALDPDTTSPIRVHIYVDGHATVALTADTTRLDVGRIYGKGDNHGYTATVKATYGTHQVCVYAIDTTGGRNRQLRCAGVDVNGTAIGALESAVASPGKITVSGWALDPNTTAPIHVHLYVDDKGPFALAANTSRVDVGRIFGKGNNHGFDGTLTAAAGPRKVCVYAMDSAGGSNPRIGCRNVTVP